MVEMYKQNKGEDDIYRVFLNFGSLQLEKTEASPAGGLARGLRPLFLN